MAGTLHIVRSAGAPHPWDLLAHEVAADTTCSVVLIQEAVSAAPGLPCPTFLLASDARSRAAASAYPMIDEQGLLDLIWDAEKVVVW